MEILSKTSPARKFLIGVSVLYCALFSYYYWSDVPLFWRTLQQMDRFPLFAFLMATYVFMAVAVVELLRMLFLMALSLVIKPKAE